MIFFIYSIYKQTQIYSTIIRYSHFRSRKRLLNAKNISNSAFGDIQDDQSNPGVQLFKENGLIHRKKDASWRS